MTFYRYGMDTALMKFYIQKETRQTYLSSIFILQLLSSIGFSIILILFKNPLSLFLTENGNSIFIIYIAAIIFFDIIWNLLIITFRVEGKAIHFVGFNITNVVLLLSLTIYFVNFQNMGVAGVLLGNVYASGIICLGTCLFILCSGLFSIKAVYFSK